MKDELAREVNYDVNGTETREINRALSLGRTVDNSPGGYSWESHTVPVESPVGTAEGMKTLAVSVVLMGLDSFGDTRNPRTWRPGLLSIVPPGLAMKEGYFSAIQL